MPLHISVDRNPCRRGLTLVEILVVVSIIAIIVGLSFTFFTAANRFGDDLKEQARAGVGKVKADDWPPAPPARRNETPPLKHVDAGKPRTLYVPPPEEPFNIWSVTTVKRLEASGIGAIPKAEVANAGAGRKIEHRDLASVAKPPYPHWNVNSLGRVSPGTLFLNRPLLALGGPQRYRPGGLFADLVDSDVVPLSYRLTAPLNDDLLFPFSVSATLAAAAPAGNSIVWDNYPPASAFLLHSNPGASSIIYMDFDGHTTAPGNRWSDDFNEGKPIIGLSWSMDADRNTFTLSERAKIIEMWRVVAEDYMPFDVDVTTEDPGVGVLQSSSTIRAVIGPTPTVSKPIHPGGTDWNGVGGLAYLHSFKGSSGPDVVCWNWNGDSDPKPEDSLPDTVSHEVGHTLGLNHDGSPPLGYYVGHGGSGPTSWGPIMGAPYPTVPSPIKRNLTQWSRNTYPNADNSEDDLATIVGGNGFGYRPDDHSDTATSATPLNPGLQATLTTTYGIIEKETDVDSFAFFADPGPLKIQIDPLFIGPNLDVQAELYSPSGTLLLTSNPGNQLDATLATTVTTKGTFQVKIRGAALLPILPAGYPTYGSIGNYRISGLVTPLTPSFDSFKTMSPLRWRYDARAKVYEGTITIAAAKDLTLSGNFIIELTMPDPSITVASPAGTTRGQAFLIPVAATIAPGAPLLLRVQLDNPRNLTLPTGYHSIVTNITQNN